MEHLQIAYDLFVIMIGLAALSIVFLWAARTGESDLRNFSLYTCFALVPIIPSVDKESTVYIGTTQSFSHWLGRSLRHPTPVWSARCARGWRRRQWSPHGRFRESCSSARWW